MCFEKLRVERSVEIAEESTRRLANAQKVLVLETTTSTLPTLHLDSLSPNHRGISWWQVQGILDQPTTLQTSKQCCQNVLDQCNRQEITQFSQISKPLQTIEKPGSLELQSQDRAFEGHIVYKRKAARPLSS